MILTQRWQVYPQFPSWAPLCADGWEHVCGVFADLLLQCNLSFIRAAQGQLPTWLLISAWEGSGSADEPLLMITLLVLQAMPSLSLDDTTEKLYIAKPKGI